MTIFEHIRTYFEYIIVIDKVKFKPINIIYQMSESPQPQHEQDFIKVNKKGIAYAIAAFLYQILVCLVYGLLLDYHPDLGTTYGFGHILFISILTILAVVGFGLINAYVTHAGFSGMALTLLIFALTIQHYFMIRAFWDKAGTNDPTTAKSFDVKEYPRISFINTGQDRGLTYELSYASLSDAIACAISMIVAFASLVGRIQALQVFFLTLFGTFFYEVNSQLMWNIYITDIGYGMRIFLFGSFMGIVSSCILGRPLTTVNHRYYKSVYSSRSLGLVGLVVVFCTFPMLVVGGVYGVSTNYAYITYIAPFNMWLALGAGILGSFSISAIINGKIFLHDLVYSGLAGGIAFSSSSNLNRNPAVPLTIGFLISFVVTGYHSRVLRKVNKSGVRESLGGLNMYLIPGFFSGVLSAVLQAIDEGSLTNYVMRASPERSPTQQGGYQIIGILLSMAIGIFAGVIIGLIFKITNRHSRLQQFNDNAIYALDRKQVAAKYIDERNPYDDEV